ncbi:amino acid/amide ABC transporter membrane protein 2, HAAT family /amino acid/amide ABC transporter ATP-binding protein 1, HAAT family [Nakamurella panacisegetis]|uniref:Amino acid/amide ABC transporter membrane protein 2, HAAT family /amino acid/amide ABC transporter ATP-binding protein 1, HAAT family n=1 Tax=Nakamurella panacisegetis TaxID=1090615 RepID=A0A1H0LAH1_9ACTN|nr:branched-chain amino acid ABC transporter ATP-binding protein/permease [Nakamurella panacisegetis]SDO65003.1 amino acid/amide ABC transporter membrane protein 2, HAAT family /amino acid/amide ABC transporter ATP-binding protein 1, HAAT family [Nakamurella panacisegetis]
MTYYLISLAGLLPIFIILGLSFNLLLGYGGLLSVSHGGFFGVGAYVTAILITNNHLEFIPAVLIAAAITGVVSLSVGYAAGRLSDEFLFIVTIAVQVALVELFNNLSVTGRSAGFAGIPRPTIAGFHLNSNTDVGVLIWICCAIVAVICYRVVRSPYGLLLKALREDVPAARSLGKRALRTKVTVFAFSAAIAGVAGGLYACNIQFVSPADFTVDRSVEILALTIIGGLAAFWGPFLGATVVVVLPEALSFANIPDTVAGPINGIIYTLAVLVLLVLRPQGILGRKDAVRSKVVTAGSDAAVPEPVDASPSRPDPTVHLGIGAPEPGVPHQPPVELRSDGLGVAFGGLKAVDCVSMAVRPGEITALVGPNGAGKTTLFNLLTGAVRADEGRSFFGDREITRLSIERRAQLGVVRSFQEMRLFAGMSVLENVQVAASDPAGETLLGQFLPVRFRRGRGGERQRAEEVLRTLGLDDRRDVLARDLSYAEQKMLMMARLLATGARCYLLDEPMSGLDQAARSQLTALLRRMVQDGTSVCIVEHSMQVVREVASWVLFLESGHLLTEGTPEDVMSDPELRTIYFGQPA